MDANLLHSTAAWAWRTSLDALPLALAAVALWRWIPTTWRWLLPSLFFLRLAVPHGIEMNWHWRTAVVSQVAPIWTVAGDAQRIPAPEPVISTLALVLPILWLAGVFSVIVWLAWSQWLLRRKISTAVNGGDQTVQEYCDWAAARMGLSSRVPARVVPGWTALAVCGWVSPVLLVPEDFVLRFTPAQIRGMLLHEMAHIRRRDVLWTWLALAICALHWFNPFAWLALRRFHADREVACDAAALRALEPSARHSYGEALLLCLRSSPAALPTPALAPFFRRFPELQRRLQYIMKPTPPTLTGRLIAFLIIPTLAAITFSTARAQQRDGDAPKPAERPAGERAVRDGERKEQPLRDGDQPKAVARDGDRPKAAPRDGDRPKAGPREGDKPREVAREGDQPRTATRDGDKPKTGARDGDRPKAEPRDGDRPREGDRPRDGDKPRTGARDGDRPKAAPREGDRPRDGDKPRTGARDGDQPKAGPRDGDKPRAEKRDGEPAREGDARKPTDPQQPAAR